MENVQSKHLEMPAHSENNMQVSLAGEITIPAELQKRINAALEV